jgi:hypothetical protein
MTVAFKQSVTASQALGLSTLTTGAMASNTVVGDVVVICVSSNDVLAHVDSVSDSKGNTWTTGPTAVFSLGPNKPRASLFVSTLTVAGAGHTFTATSSGAATSQEMSVASFSGVTSVIDSSGTTNAGNSTTTITATAATATFTDNLVFGVFTGDSVTNPAANVLSPATVSGAGASPVSLFVNQNGTANSIAQHTYGIVTGAASRAVNWTYNPDASGFYTAVAMQLRGLTPATVINNQFLYYQSKSLYPI